MIMSTKKEKQQPSLCGGIKTFKWVDADGNEIAPDTPAKVRDADALRDTLRKPKN